MTEKQQLQELLDGMDDAELAQFLFTMRAVERLKSEAAITQRMIQFRDWFHNYRAAKAGHEGATA